MPPPLFLRPSRPSLPRFPRWHRPLLVLFSFLTAPTPFPFCPLLLRHPHYYSLSGAPLYLSSPNVFIVAVFSRDSSPFAVCPCIASSLPRALRTKRALLSALPGNVLTSVLLFLRRSARLLSRARSLFCHYPLCFLHILYSTILFSLPSLLPASQFFASDFPSLRLPIVPECVRLLSRAIPNLV